jgi:hypothetical protein
MSCRRVGSAHHRLPEPWAQPTRRERLRKDFASSRWWHSPSPPTPFPPGARGELELQGFNG